MKQKVVLFFPPYDGPPLGAPACLLALASPLLQAGFEVSIIDAAIVPDFESAIVREARDALCLGISLLTGPMITSAVKLARQVKQIRPEVPVIFGGWHPGLVPEETVRPDYVDAVVRGQGEITLVEIAKRLAASPDLSGIRGVTFKKNRLPVNEPDRPVENLDNLPLPAYHLMDFDAYEKASGRRAVGYASSVGCPYACSYCTDQVFYNRRFNAHRPERVVSEVVDLVQRYRLDEVAFLDSNFPVDLKRALAVARGFVESKVKLNWSVQASTDLLCRMSDEDVMLLGKAGLAHLGFGTESASQEVLALMNKKHQRVQDMYETARKTEAAGIHVTFNIILGYPGETEDDRRDTFRILGEIAHLYSDVSFSPNIFTPYPGLPIWPELERLGVRKPQSLEEWAVVSLGNNLLPWLQGDVLRRLQRQLGDFLSVTQRRRTAAEAAHVHAPVARRSLVTGVELSRDLREVC